MKKTMTLFVLFLGLITLHAQLQPNYQKIKLKTAEDFTNEANDAALEAANYILSTPINENDTERLLASAYLIKWMQGTPDYTFELHSTVLKSTHKQSGLLIVYMAALAKVVLDTSIESSSKEDINLQSARLLIHYAQNKKNKVKVNADFKKMMAAEKENNLLEYLSH